MRGEERRQRAMLMIMGPGDRVPREHPLERVKELADAALGQLSPLFDGMYRLIGRPPIPPERLLKASLLMALYTVPASGCCASSSITTCCPAGSSIWMWPSRALTIRPSRATGCSCWSTTVAREFFTRVVAQARSLQLLSDEHFTVDNTLVEALGVAQEL
jgi:transposase